MDELQKKIDEYSPYLEDLSGRIYFLTIFFVITFAFGFLCFIPIIKFLTRIFHFEDVVLAATSPFQLLDLAMDAGLFTAVLLTAPVFLYHLYAFIGNGLRKKEKKMFFFLLPLILFLFLFGFTYSFSILYYAMQTFADINTSLGFENLWDIRVFLSQIISTSALLGLIFEFPIVLIFLIKVGILSGSFLKEKRRHAVFFMFLSTALLPPTDGVSLLMMVVPLLVMYEATIMYNEFSVRGEQTS